MEITTEDLSEMYKVNNLDLAKLMREEETLSMAIEGLVDLSFRSTNENAELIDARQQVAKVRSDILRKAKINRELVIDVSKYED